MVRTSTSYLRLFQCFKSARRRRWCDHLIQGGCRRPGSSCECTPELNRAGRAKDTTCTVNYSYLKIPLSVLQVVGRSAMIMVTRGANISCSHELPVTRFKPSMSFTACSLAAFLLFCCSNEELKAGRRSFLFNPQHRNIL